MMKKMFVYGIWDEKMLDPDPGSGIKHPGSTTLMECDFFFFIEIYAYKKLFNTHHDLFCHGFCGT
jgi:hypothetical protein